ncbi:MAG: histidine phosphatase family protein [Lautropia sp.]
MSIILVRHGETALNASRTLQHPDTPLGPRGLAQAEAVARRLAGEPIDEILVSDHLRAAQTAHAIARAVGAPVRVSPLLHERSFGALRGRRYDELGFDPMAPDFCPPDGESWPVFEARVALAFAEIVARRAALARALVVVSHGLVIGRMLRHHLRLAAGAAPPMHLGNTAVTIFDADPPHLASLVGCIAHLDGAARDDGRGLSGF